MADVDFLSPSDKECILTTHSIVLSRATANTGVVNGNRVTASLPASRIINVSAGRIRFFGAPFDLLSDTIQHDIGGAFPRIDILYRNDAGAVALVKGVAAEIEDPKQLASWISYTSPSPSSTIPDGVILAAVYVPAGSSALTDAFIRMFAGRVADISTAVATPGLDTISPSEKAVRTLANTKISHSLATALNDMLMASGSGVFVKKTLAEVKVILGLGTAAYTASSNYVPHSLAINANDFLVASGAGAFIKKTLAEVKTILGLGTAAYTAVGDYATAGHNHTGVYQPLITRTFLAVFPFGDGSAVITEGSAVDIEIPIASKIVSAEIREAGLGISSVTCSLYIHDRGAAIGNVVDAFALASMTDMEETGLNIAVAAKKWLTVVTGPSGITARQITCILTLEAT